MRTPITGRTDPRWRKHALQAVVALLLLGGSRGCGFSWKASDYDGDGDGYAFLEDCSDGDPDVHPGASEIWYDGIDQNCDRASDFDADQDGFDQDQDCEDEDPEVNPEAKELCGDAVDNDCDGLTDGDDEDATSPFFPDGDTDGYGAGTFVEVQGCAPPTGYSERSDDCDDADPLVHPDADEDCGAVDRNCDGDPIEGATDAPTWYQDNDEDGFGDPDSAQQACTQPADTISVGFDCEDTDSDINPDASEVCNGIDDDCDGLTDDQDDSVDQTTQTLWFIDQDQDGSGRNRSLCYNAICACAAPLPAVCYTDNSGDCDDNDSSIQTECDGYTYKDWSSTTCPLTYDSDCTYQELDPDDCEPIPPAERR